MIKKSPYPISYYGLRLDSWKKNLKESLLWSSGFILVISIAKLVYINTIASESNDPFFQLTDIKDKSFLFSLTFISLYSIFSIFQEFITRSGVQSPLLRFLTGKYVNTKAIILSTLLFASTHLHLNSIAFAIVVIVPGIFWGIMYARQNSLLGVSVSHILIGVWGAFIMGFPGSY